MKHFTNCPLCSNQLKKVGQTVSCSCGWSKSFNQAGHNNIQTSIVKKALLTGVAIFSLFIHISQWGGSSLAIMPLKAQQWSGFLSKNSYTRLQEICMSMKKYDCVESAHRAYYQASQDLEVLSELGNFQFRRSRFAEAGQTYKLYFQNKGQDVKSAYNYARILEKQGLKDHALSYYKYAIKSRPDTLQISVVRAYINLLVKEGQVSQARQELRLMHDSVQRAGDLVQQEYQRWQKQVRG